MNKLSVSDLAIIQLLSVKPLYGLELLDKLKDIGVSISIGTIYSTLKRLHTEGLLSHVNVASDTKNSHRKAHYTATQKGKDVFLSTIKLLNQLQNG